MDKMTCGLILSGCHSQRARSQGPDSPKWSRAIARLMALLHPRLPGSDTSKWLLWRGPVETICNATTQPVGEVAQVLEHLPTWGAQVKTTRGLQNWRRRNGNRNRNGAGQNYNPGHHANQRLKIDRLSEPMTAAESADYPIRPAEGRDRQSALWRSPLDPVSRIWHLEQGNTCVCPLPVRSHVITLRTDAVLLCAQTLLRSLRCLGCH